VTKEKGPLAGLFLLATRYSGRDWKLSPNTAIIIAAGISKYNQKEEHPSYDSSTPTETEGRRRQ
jgi:hypothetical protein